MNIPKNFQSQLKLRLNKEYNETNLGNQKSNNATTNKLKTDLVDKVVLTTVDSSSFDKYVQTIENGKKSVADKFIEALETFADQFIDGINNTTETKEEEQTDAKTDKNIEQK